MGKYPHLFSSFESKGLKLKNRVTMAPLFLGMANLDGTVSELMLDHYREMGATGVALVVAESSAVDPLGMGTPNMLRVDKDEYIEGLARLARAIKDGGALAFLQINHTGRYAYHPERQGPSTIKMDYVTVREMTPSEIEACAKAYADSARRVKDAGFDGVELHGGTGYLLVQFLSPRSNKRSDEFGGSLENRMRFPLLVVDAVRDAVGSDFPVGYRFLAEEWLSDGLHPEETTVFAKKLEEHGIAYLSVTTGTYESFFLPEYIEAEKKEGYQVEFAKIIKQAVSHTPVITAGRIQNPATAEEILKEGKADLIGLARVLLADPQWFRKAKGEITEPINPCQPGCQFCMKRVMKTKVSYCIRWDKEKRFAFQTRIGEKNK